MTRVFSFQNLDKKALSLSQPPIIVNMLKLETEEDRKFLESLTVTRYDSTDVMATVPACLCRRTQQAHRLGEICRYCNTRVVSPHNKEIESDVWITTPPGIEYFLAPLPWIMLADKLKSRNWNGVAWAMDPTYPDPESNNKRGELIVSRFKGVGYRRGMRYLPEELNKLIDVAVKSAPNEEKRLFLIRFMDRYRDALLVKHIPIPSKISSVVEGTAVGNYYDKTISYLIETVFAAADTRNETNIRRSETRFTNALLHLEEYYRAMMSDTLSSKSGWLRRVVYGNRMNFSFRNIITSEHGLHDYGTMRAPYHQVLACLRPFVVTRLIKRHNMSYAEAFEYVEAHARDNDPLLWDMLEEMIDETPPGPVSRATTVVVPDAELGTRLVKIPSTLRSRERKGGGLMTALTRYPSLARTSTQGLRLVGLTKTEIRLSVLALAGPNADKRVVGFF